MISAMKQRYFTVFNIDLSKAKKRALVSSENGKRNCMKGNKYKEEVRRTKAWKDFRKEIIEERGSICECCGTKTKRISLHHADESLEHYADFTDKSKFFLVCSLCHKNIERLARIKPENWCKYNPEWVAFYSRYLLF